MNPRAAVRLAWAIVAVTCSLAVAGMILGLLSGQDARPEQLGAISAVFVAFAGAVSLEVVGALVLTRYPRNPVGWILCVVGLSLAISRFCIEYATYTVLAEPGVLPGGLMTVWLGEWTWTPTTLVGTLLLLLFPGDRLSSPRWRPVAWLAVAGMIGVAVHEAFSPGRLETFPDSNPFGLSGAGGQIADALALSYVIVNLAGIAAVSLLVIRLHRATGDERQQLKWLASGGTVLFLGVLVSNLLPGEPVLPILIGYVAIAAAVGVGILRYRLYDIDVVVNRTLVYGALTATLGLAYLGAVLLLGMALRPLTASSNLAIAGSTLAVAALFRPARARIQQVVDRRFYRRKYDATRTLEAFSARLRDEVDLDTLGTDLRAVVNDTMQPAHVSLWLRAPEAPR